MRKSAAALILASIAVVYVLVYADLTLRARSACLQGDQYMRWHRDASLKKAYCDDVLAREKSRLDGEKSAGRMDDLEYRQRLALARFEYDDRMAESSLKYAYHWYQTAAELFAPPQNRWTRRSREMMDESKRLWRQELQAARIPYKDYMLE